ncbi:hemolymph juvenile hormone binding protein (JHBP) [Popillia japonica]|uniref:Hemolymph juvenile hormone binding protein (JHBP) n=1 Tax=Popillia japonica TaxID=7064 RepID=A0AAW1HR38_POPJA
MWLSILLVFTVLAVGFAEELPSFIKKCTLGDPEVSKCIVTNGNLVIPELVKGSKFFGVPSATPLHIAKIDLPGTDFTVSLSNVRLFGMENIRIKDVSFMPGVEPIKMTLTVPHLNLTADYTAVSNSFFLSGLLAGGKVRTSLVEDVLVHNFLGKIIVREDKNYYKLSNHTTTLTTKRIYYQFSDFYASSTGDFNEFLNRHKRIVDERIKPGVEKILSTYLVAALSHLTVNFPPDLTQIRANLVASNLNLTGDFIIISNDFYYPRILGGGKLHTNLDNNLIEYEATAGRNKIQKEIFFHYKQQKAILQTKRIFYEFSNLYGNNLGDFFQVLNSYKRIVDERIKPGVEAVLRRYITTATSNTVSKEPLRKIFHF